MDKTGPQGGPGCIPEDFPYKEAARRGRPQHGELDEFRRKHPAMDVGKRAKIFAPFAALRGFEMEIEETAEAHVKFMNRRR